MMITNALVLVALSLAQAPKPPPGSPAVAPSKAVPADWPPPPNFRQPVDYVKWWNDRLARGRVDDAVPLYEKLDPPAGSAPEVIKASAKRWGENEKGELPGLFTGEAPPPSHYAWDPKDHPDWEAAYQVNRQLRDEILAVSRKRFFAGRFKPVRPDDPVLKAFGAAGPPLMAADGPQFVTVRRAAEVLLQNAWRAPGGQPDRNELKTAVLTTLRMARQLTAPSPSAIQLLVAIGVRDLAYGTALRALQEDVFNNADVAELNLFLAADDNWTADMSETQPLEVAHFFDTLQYCYVPTGNKAGPPQANLEHIEVLEKYLSQSREFFPSLFPEPLDLRGEIDQCGPQDGVVQFLALSLEARAILKAELPAEAEAKLAEVIAPFKADPKNHVIVRQFGPDVIAARAATLAVRDEARRRAVRAIFLLDAERRKTGQWPESLGRVRGLAGSNARIDPYSRKEFIYRKTADGMTLYSVATNGKDDGGKHHEQWGENHGETGDSIVEGDFVFWPVQRTP